MTLTDEARAEIDRFGRYPRDHSQKFAWALLMERLITELEAVKAERERMAYAIQGGITCIMGEDPEAALECLSPRSRRTRVMGDLHHDLTTCPADASPETLRELRDRVLHALGLVRTSEAGTYPDGVILSNEEWAATVPNPAANLQDAVDLDRKGWELTLDEVGRKGWDVQLTKGKEDIYASGATPALAVCAALMKAKGET